MNELANIYRGKSFSIGFTIPDEYDESRIEDLKVNIGTKVYQHTIVQGVIGVSLTSNDTAKMVGRQDVVLTIEDSLFGVQKLNCGYVYVSSTISKFQSESFSDVYDVMVMLSFYSERLSVDHVLFDYLKGKSAYEYAVDGGYLGTEEQFYLDLAKAAIAVPYTGADKDVDLGANGITVDNVTFNQTPESVIAPLKLQYNDDEKTLEFGLADGGKLQIGKEMFEEYTNIDTVPLTNGMIVSTAAIPGNRKGIKRTDFTNLTSIRSIVGMVTVGSIAVNGAGRVTTKGIINDLNTNGWAEGLQLWGNPAVLGGWSGSKPSKPQYAVQIGQVVVASATVGSVELNVAKDVKFSDLADVNGSTSSIDDTDTIPKRDADGIIREITVADIKADFKADTDALYEPLLGFTPENTANKGQANGYASLGADGLVPSNQLPSFVDDVLEFANLAAFPVTGEQGKIYVALDTNKTYRWSGSAYIYITSGAVDSVAGKTGVVTLVKGDVGLGNVDNTPDANKPVSTAQQNALDLKIDKTLLTEITTVADNETMAVKASDSIWKRITWANIKATLKTYFETLFVTLTGAQNIAGVKTFTDSPVVPNPVNNGDAANKAFVQSVITVGNDTYQENKLITDARVATLENVINSANINQETTATVTGVDVVSLPKTAANTGMQVQMFGQSAQNLVVNGNFANGTTGWTVSNSTIAVSNSNLTITGTGASVIATAKSTTFSGVNSNDKIYIYSRIRALNSKSLQMRARMTNEAVSNTYGDAVISSPVEGQWYSISGVINKAVTFSSFVILLQSEYATTGDQLNSRHEVDNVIAINLTATYGTGNEPTKEQCDILFANYFEGSDNVLGTGRVRSVGKNLLNLDTRGKRIYTGQSDGMTQAQRLLYYDILMPITRTGIVSGSISEYVILPERVEVTTNSANYGIGFKIKAKEGDIYNFSTTQSNGYIGVGVFDNSGAAIANYVASPFTCPANTSFISVVFTPSSANVKAIFTNTQLSKGSVVNSFEPYRQSILQLTTPPLRSNGTIKDEIRKGTNGYELVKRVGVGTLGAELITNAADREFSSDTGWWTKAGLASINAGGSGLLNIKTTDGSQSSISRLNLIASGKLHRLKYDIVANRAGNLNVSRGATIVGIDSTAGVNKRFIYTSDGAGFAILRRSLEVNVDIDVDNLSLKEITLLDGANLDTNFTELSDGTVLYTLATPVITPIAHAGLLNSNSNGTAYFEPIIADAGVYASNIAVQLTDYPIASFESIRKYANGTYTELNTATAVIASGGLSFTHPDLVSGDLVMFTYAYNKESIGRSMTLTHYDSRFVIADTANSKVYRWRITSTNGVASIALTEV